MQKLKIEIEDLFQNGIKVDMKQDKTQLLMSPPTREIYLKNTTNYIDAAVAILIYKKDDGFYFPLIKRASNDKDKHSGQISLPGGKFESADYNLLDCSKRELQEEIGVNTEKISYIAELNELLIPVSNFKVHPFIFLSDSLPNFSIQTSEVKELLEIKFEDLANNKNSKIGEVELTNGFKLGNVPYFLLNSHKIWGATAMILSEFKNVCTKLKTFQNKER